MEEISLFDLLDYFLLKLKIIIIFTIVGALLGLLYEKKFIVPKYKSYTTVVLSTSKEEESITQSEVSLNNNLVKTYAEIIKSRKVLTRAIRNLKLDTTYENLYSSISVTALNDTQIIKIIVEDYDSDAAKDIADEVADIFTEEITKLYKIDNINVLDKAFVSSAPYNINVAKGTVIGGLLSFVFIVSLCFCFFYFDQTIKSKEEVEKILNVPVIGTIYEYKGGKE